TGPASADCAFVHRTLISTAPPPSSRHVSMLDAGTLKLPTTSDGADISGCVLTGVPPPGLVESGPLPLVPSPLPGVAGGGVAGVGDDDASGNEAGGDGAGDSIGVGAAAGVVKTVSADGSCLIPGPVSDAIIVRQRCPFPAALKRSIC